MPRSPNESWKYHKDCTKDVISMFHLLNTNLEKSPQATILPPATILTLADNLFGAFELNREHGFEAMFFPENGASKLIFDSLSKVKEGEITDDNLYNLLQFLDRIGFDKIPGVLLNRAVKVLNASLKSFKEGKISANIANIDYYLLHIISHLTSVSTNNDEKPDNYYKVLKNCFELCSDVFSRYEAYNILKPTVQRFFDLALVVAAKEKNQAKKDRYLSDAQVNKVAEIVCQNSVPTISILQRFFYNNLINNFENFGFKKEESDFGDDQSKRCIYLVRDDVKIKVELEGIFHEKPLMTSDIVITTFNKESKTGIYPIEVDGPLHFFKVLKKDEIDIFCANGKTARREEVAKGLGFTENNRLVLDCPTGSSDDRKKTLLDFVVKIVEAHVTEVEVEFEVEDEVEDEANAKVEKKQAATSQSHQEVKPPQETQETLQPEQLTTQESNVVKQEQQATAETPSTQNPLLTQDSAAASTEAAASQNFQDWLKKMLEESNPSQRDLDTVIASLAEIPEKQLQALKDDKNYLDSVLKKIKAGNSNQSLKNLAQQLNIKGFDCNEENKEYFKSSEQKVKERILFNLESCINSRDGLDVFLTRSDLIPTIGKLGFEHGEKVYQLIKKIILYCKSKNDEKSKKLFNLVLSHPDLIDAVLSEWSTNANMMLKILLDNKTTGKKKFEENDSNQEQNLFAFLRLENVLIKNNPSVQNALGLQYREGRLVKINEKKAVELFKLAATQKYANAFFNLGICWEKGVVVEKNSKRAAFWYEEAAKQGNVNAYVNLGLLYMLEANDLKKNEDVSWKKKEQEAFELFKLAADRGNPYAQLILGDCYERGMGVQKDCEKAVQLYQLSADQGEKRGAEALYNLAVRYQSGKGGVSQDYEKALELYKLAANQYNFLKAQTFLSKAYRIGIPDFIEKNQKDAIKYCKMAANSGDVNSQIVAASYYREVEIDSSKAIHYFTLAAKKGSLEAIFRLGFIYQASNNEAKAFELYQYAAKKGHPAATYHLGLCYKYGKGVAIDEKKAFETFQLGADKLNPECQTSLGLCYQMGVGVDKDEKKAVELYQLAVKKNLSYAQRNLALCYKNGVGVDKDEKEAVRLYKLAAAQGHKEADEELSALLKSHQKLKKGDELSAPADINTGNEPPQPCVSNPEAASATSAEQNRDIDGRSLRG